MKLRTRMILIFSLMILLIVAVNTIYLVSTNVDGSMSYTEDRYKNMSNNMIRALEQYVSLMDLAIEDITSDTTFMEAFYAIKHADASDSTAAQQSLMLQTLIRSPIVSKFYRVSVFTDEGFYISNKVNQKNVLASMDAEAFDHVWRVHYLSAAKAAPYRRHIIAPHDDCFSEQTEQRIFSVVHAVTWRGEHLGYIEVAALEEDMNDLFVVDNPNVHVRATLSSGDVLYADEDDTAIYDDIALNQFVTYTDPTGLNRNVYHVESRSLNVDIHIASDEAYIGNMVWRMLLDLIRWAALIALAALLLVALVSIGMTRSIRLFQRRIRALRINDLLLMPDTSPLREHAVSMSHKDLYQMESSFNHLLVALHDATSNEMSLRESSLRSRLQALQTQINPHFIYNTLNIIAAKGMESSNEDIVDMCSQFAGMLRYSTDTRSESATLQADLDHVENYLHLLKARFEDRLMFTIDVPEPMLSMTIPKLTLQPLVENAMTHGFDKQTDMIRCISISGHADGHTFTLEVRDNGRGFAPDVLDALQRNIEQIQQNPHVLPDSQEHIGLLNTCMRLRYFSKGAMWMTLLNDGGAVVRLTMEKK